MTLRAIDAGVPHILMVDTRMKYGNGGIEWVTVSVHGDEDTAAIKMAWSTNVMPTEAEVKASKPERGRSVEFHLMPIHEGDVIMAKVAPVDDDGGLGWFHCLEFCVGFPEESREQHTIDGWGPP